jgi:hypothetical protein
LSSAVAYDAVSRFLRGKQECKRLPLLCSSTSSGKTTRGHGKRGRTKHGYSRCTGRDAPTPTPDAIAVSANRTSAAKAKNSFCNISIEVSLEDAIQSCEAFGFRIVRPLETFHTLQLPKCEPNPTGPEKFAGTMRPVEEPVKKLTGKTWDAVRAQRKRSGVEPFAKA